MRQAHSIDRHIVSVTAAMAVLLTACGSGSTSSDGSVTGPATGGSTLPGNEAIPDLGTLSRGGMTALSGGAGSLGGSATASGGSASANGGAPSTGGTVTAIGGNTNQGGDSTSAIGGAVAAGGNSDSAGGAGGVNVGGRAAIGGQATTGGTSAKGGSGGNSTNTGGTSTNTGGSAAAGGIATGGNAATGGTVATGGSAAYHTLANWVSPEANNKNHHGRMYFIANAQKDDQGLACNACHGSNFEGTASAPACASCHTTWRSCTFCHGTGTSQNPPRGVFDESAISTLAVGRHAKHLSAGSSHLAFACNTCHTIPVANDVTHLLSYVPSSDLTTSGHHGDVKFSGVAAATTWNVNATSGTPVSARGTCLGACHSNGRGGNPAKTPYWAGGAWTTGCTNCHGATGSTRNGEHGHGFPGSTCADCHTGATATSYTAATHMNGRRDFRTSPGGRAAGMTLTANWSCSNVSCHSDD